MSQKAWEDETQRANCIMLLKELTSPENVGELAEDSGFISNIELGNYAPEETVMSKKGENLVNASTELVGAVDWFINRNIWENIIIKQFPNVLRGRMSPEEVYELVDEAMMQVGK